MGREVESSDVETEEWEHPSGGKKGKTEIINSCAGGNNTLTLDAFT